MKLKPTSLGTKVGMGRKQCHRLLMAETETYVFFFFFLIGALCIAEIMFATFQCNGGAPMFFFPLTVLLLL